MSNILLVHSSDGRDELLHYSLASLNLYETEKSEEALEPKLLNADTFSCLKCLAWSADGSSLASGNFEGRVSIFAVNREDAPFVSMGDLLPKQSRPCNAIAWNATHKSVLAIGFDEHSTGMSLFIVNLTRCLTCRLSASSKRGLLLCPCETSEKVQHMCGPGESTDSIVWQRSNNSVLLRGASNTCIQVLDLRCGVRPQICVATKATYGLDVDYFRDTLVSSHYVNVVKLWDLRRANHKLFAIDTPSPIVKTAWNPNRSGSLAYLYQSSNAIKTCQVWCATNSSERTLASRLLPSDLFHLDSLNTFCWLPSFGDYVAAANESQGVAICRYGQSDLLAWNANNELAFSSDSRNIQTKAFVDDISVVMKRRAQAGYGLPDGMVLSRHANLCDGNEEMTWLWSWLQTAWKLQEEEQVSLSGTRFPGIKAVLLSSVNDRCMSFDEPIAALTKGVCRQISVSQNRANCLTLCGWDEILKSNLFSADPVLLKLFQNGDFERALFIAGITKRLPVFRNLLSEWAKPPEKRYNDLQSVMALILATPCYSGSFSAWNATCANLQATVENSYLKGLLSFFSGENIDAAVSIFLLGQFLKIHVISVKHVCFY
uniref:MIOS-like alpha-solenoid domain-containing protein n=1 Tax=Trichuris muris TaxID=70415 RepID=A0A5S6QLQ1_TRIMR